MRRFPITVLGSVFVLLMLTQPVSAGSPTVSYIDRPDDLAKNWAVTSLNPYNYVLVQEWADQSIVGQVGYVDIVSGWLTHHGNSLVFGMEVAADMPTEGSIPGVSYVIWGFYAFFSNDGNDGLDIYLLWNGENYQAYVQDSRPFMSGGTWAYTEIAPHVEGAMLTLAVSAKQLDFPSEFYWCFKTLMIMGNIDPTPTAWTDFRGGTMAWADLTDPQCAVSPHPLPALWFFPMLPSPP